jgi:hypothetical protein
VVQVRGAPPLGVPARVSACPRGSRRARACLGVPARVSGCPRVRRVGVPAVCVRNSRPEKTPGTRRIPQKRSRAPAPGGRGVEARLWTVPAPGDVCGGTWLTRVLRRSRDGKSYRVRSARTPVLRSLFPRSGRLKRRSRAMFARSPPTGARGRKSPHHSTPTACSQRSGRPRMTEANQPAPACARTTADADLPRPASVRTRRTADRPHCPYADRPRRRTAGCHAASPATLPPGGSRDPGRVGSATPPLRSPCRGPASSVPAGRASRSGGCAPSSGRAPCRPRSGCAPGRRRCRNAS